MIRSTCQFRTKYGKSGAIAVFFFYDEFFIVLDRIINKIRKIRRMDISTLRIRDQWELDIERDHILGRGLEDLRFLIAAGVSVNQEGASGHTPLHAAVRFGLVSCVSVLLEARPFLDASVLDTTSYTALNIAGSLYGSDRVSIVKQLILAGAKVTIVDAKIESLIYMIAAGADAPRCVFYEYAKAGDITALRFLIVEYGISEIQKPTVNAVPSMDFSDTPAFGWLHMIISRWPLESAALLEPQRDRIDEVKCELTAAMRLRARPMITELSIVFREFPALVTLFIVDAASDWHPQYRLLTMHYKWCIITLIKHFKSN